MSTRRGANASLLIGKQADLTTVATVGHKIPVASMNLGAYQGAAIQSDELRDDLNPALGFTDLFKTDGPFDHALTADAVGLLMYFFLTDYSVAGVGPYVHTFKPAATDPSPLTAEVAHYHASTPKHDRFLGVYLSRFQIQVDKRGGLLRMPWEIMGTGNKVEDQAASFDAAPATYTDERLQARKAVLKIDGSTEAKVRQASLSVVRQVEASMGLNGLDYDSEMIFGGYEFELSFTATFDHASTVRALEDGAAHTFEIVVPRIADATRYLSIKFEECIVPKTDKVNISDRRALTYSFSGLRPGYETAGAGTGLTVKVASDIADYSAIV